MISQEGKKKEFRLIQGKILINPIFNFVNIRGVVQHYKQITLIRAMVQDFAFDERSTFYSTQLHLIE